MAQLATSRSSTLRRMRTIPFAYLTTSSLRSLIQCRNVHGRIPRYEAASTIAQSALRRGTCMGRWDIEDAARSDRAPTNAIERTDTPSRDHELTITPLRDDVSPRSRDAIDGDRGHDLTLPEGRERQEVRDQGRTYRLRGCEAERGRSRRATTPGRCVMRPVALPGVDGEGNQCDVHERNARTHHRGRSCARFVNARSPC
jgi:hypothetical protein